MSPNRSLPKLVCALLALSVGLTTALGASDDEKRAKIRNSRDETIKELYEAKASTKESIKKCVGYAVFSNVSFSLGFTAGGGSGVVTEANGKETFMKMGTAGIGLGLGVKDFRAVFIFHDKQKMQDFIDKGWDFSGEADASAKAVEKGGAANTAGNATTDVELYQFTKNGLALSASLNGTKYWKDDDLNAK